MGRLWQTFILTEWNNLFEQIPIECLVFQKQQEYSRSINESSAQGDLAGAFRKAKDTSALGWSYSSNSAGGCSVCRRSIGFGYRQY